MSTLHLSTIETETYEILKQIFQLGIFKNKFALAGGTSLALQIGHRHSIDLDIFTNEKLNIPELEAFFFKQKKLKVNTVGKNSFMLFTFINDVKCDFVEQPYPLINPFLKIDDVNYFSVEDIAAMKLHTICGRGKRKDFFDVYALLQKYSWQNLLDFFKLKYGDGQYYALYRSIQYFVDAEKDNKINGFAPYNVKWEQVKKFILKTCV